MRTRFKVPAISFGAVVLVAATALAFASPAVATASRPASKPMTREANALALAQARVFLSHVKLGAPFHREASRTESSLTGSLNSRAPTGRVTRIPALPTPSHK